MKIADCLVTDILLENICRLTFSFSGLTRLAADEYVIPTVAKEKSLSECSMPSFR
jgi:hypothetical protein